METASPKRHRWITDGVKMKMVPKATLLPVGWRWGRNVKPNHKQIQLICEDCSREFAARMIRDNKCADGIVRCKVCRKKRSDLRNRPGKKRYRLAQKYGMTLEQYNNMLEAQSNVCAICEQPETIKNKRGEHHPLSVDHDHKTGRVRGLLCNSCNAGIGHFSEDKEVLQSAIKYLVEHS